MRHILLLTALAASFTLCAQAQTKTGTIEGTITDGRQKTVESATIALLRAQDSTTIKYAVADKSGRFQFEALPSGGYLVLVSAVGHGKTYSEKAILSDEKTHIVLPALLLQPMAKDMAAVVVTSRKPFIEQKIDRTVVNVDASVTNAGATALEVLEKSPGVSVDKDGNISLKGKQGVTVMMDGRPAYLSGAELSNYLRSLPASALDQIEIMTNPSSKYDASGNSGIINIKVKKNKQKGFNGNLSATYGQGRYWRSNGSLNLNYRTGKVNLFMNANTGMWSGFQRLDIHRKFRSGETGNLTAIFDQTSHMLRRNDFHSLKLGADVYLTSRTTVGFVTSGFINPENTTSRNVIRLMDADGKVDSVDHAYTRNEQRWKNGTFNLNFRHQFDSTGRELTADVDYIRFDSERDQIFNNITRNNSETKLRESSLRGDLPVSILIRSAKMDYTQTVAKDFKFEAGLKTSFVETDNNAGYFQVYGNREEVDYTKTNQFVYTENINAAYLNLNRQFKKFGVQAGLRYEYTRYKGHQFGNPDKGDSLFSRNYGNLFPTMFLSYTADKNNQFGLSFGRRIDRPAYQDLNPFLFFLDNYTYEQGNPFLKPQFTN
ncbi:MAG TPA: outer membrane beta-barrel protein, partial [Chitinophagaceae bacterium]|nr:outer membrane beta-barrel protein [Chitinophagaceae bacterium]